jgi:hypothetical protein
MLDSDRKISETCSLGKFRGVADALRARGEVARQLRWCRGGVARAKVKEKLFTISCDE